MPDDGRVPDPSPLTTAQLLREVTMLRDQVGIQQRSDREVLETRLNAMDRAIELLEKYPTEVDRAIVQLKDLHQEKFKGIEQRFHEREIRFENAARDQKLLLDASLLATKEAVAAQYRCSEMAIAKGEAATTKQIDYIGGLIHSTSTTLHDKIEDVKTRMTTMEGHSKGIGAGWGFLVGGIGLLATLAGLAMLLLRLKAG